MARGNLDAAMIPRSPAHQCRSSLAGAPLLEVFPIVPILGNLTLGVGVYAGQFNITAVADATPARTWPSSPAVYGLRYRHSRLPCSARQPPDRHPARDRPIISQTTWNDCAIASNPSANRSPPTTTGVEKLTFQPATAARVDARPCPGQQTTLLDARA